MEAAKACGCAFLPATVAQVALLSMQRRIFRIDGGPFVATRDGGGRCRLREGDRGGAPCRGGAGGPAPRGLGAAAHAAGLNRGGDGHEVTYEVVTERGKQAAANLRLA